MCIEFPPRELNCLVKMHNVILFCNQEQCPCVSNCCEIAMEVMEDVRPFALMIEECRELYAILTTPHLRVSLFRPLVTLGLTWVLLDQVWDRIKTF